VRPESLCLPKLHRPVIPGVVSRPPDQKNTMLHQCLCNGPSVDRRPVGVLQLYTPRDRDGHSSRRSVGGTDAGKCNLAVSYAEG
jgi:hypothetical protein